MAVIKIEQFLGRNQRVHPVRLQDGQSTEAINIWLDNGTLKPILYPTESGQGAQIAVSAKTIFRPRGLRNTDYFYSSQSSEVNFVDSPIANDAYGRVFFTSGVSTPAKFTTKNVDTSGGAPYPSVSYKLGIPIPTAPVATVGGSPTNANDPAETRYYVLTLVDEFGSEGPASGISGKVQVKPGQTVTVAMGALPDGTGRAAWSYYRLYRSATGTSGSAFLFVTQFAITTTSYIDSTLTVDLGSALATADWTEPPVGLQGLTSLPGGVLAGFKDNVLWFSEPGFPYAWPVKYQQITDYPIVGLGVFGNSVLVTTTGQPYIAQGIDPANMSMTKLEVTLPCLSRRSIVDFGDAVAYASPLGLVLVSNEGAKIVTSSIMTRSQWANLIKDRGTSLPSYENFSAVNWDGRYLFSPRSGGFDTYAYSYAINPFNPEEGVVTYQYFRASGQSYFTYSGFNAACVDKSTGDVYVYQRYANASFAPTSDGQYAFKWNDQRSPSQAVEYAWTSKVYEAGPLANFSLLQILADTYPVGFDYFGDGGLIHSGTIEDSYAVPLPSGELYRNHQIVIYGKTTVYAVYLAETPEDLKGV